MIQCILICASRFKDQGVTNALKKKQGQTVHMLQLFWIYIFH